MAFSKQPSISTYQTKMVNLLKEENRRLASQTKDTDLVNCYVELVKNKQISDNDFFLTKRSGTTSYLASVGASTIRGMHYNQDFKKLYYVVNDTMYIWSVESNTYTSINTAFFSTSTGDVGFCDYLYDTGVVVVIATDGTTLKQITSADVITASTDPDMPVPHIPTPVFLDGYLFLLKANTSDIYNSDLNNPLAWTAGNFISAEIAPDQVNYLAKLNNYLVVFGTYSIEYFWDAANATGSPLQRNDTPVKFNGYLGGFAQLGQKIYFVGNNKESEPSVFALEDFKIEELGTPTITRYLSSVQVDYKTKKCGIISCDGHSFYILNYGSITYVLDLDTTLWARWAFQQSSSFNCNAAVVAKYSLGNISLMSLDNSSAIYKMDLNVYNDIGINFTCSGVTDNQYFDSYNQKTMSKLVVWADKPSSSANMQISWSDNDYQSYITERSVDLFQERPSIDRLGRFRRRAFKWSWTQNQPLRIKGLEVDINLGIH